MQKKNFPSARLRATQLFGLWTAAISLQLLELLWKDSAFFINNDLDSRGALFTIAVICWLAPSCVIMLDLVVSKLVPPAHLLSVSALAAVFFLPILKRMSDLPGELVLIAAAAAGCSYAFFYLRSKSLQSFGAIPAAAGIVFPILFMVFTPVRELFLDDSGKAGPSPIEKLEKLPPIVFLQLDELPSTSLLGSDGKIDPRLYPNFARLASISNWFPNTLSVSDFTSIAVPAILSGKSPVYDTQPISRNYPQNLFTVLAPRYKINAYEPWTKLCPQKICEASEGNRYMLRSYQALYFELWPALLQLLLPADLWSMYDGGASVRAKLRSRKKAVDPELPDDGIFSVLRPPFPRSNPKRNRQEAYAKWLNELTESRDPVLYFAHFLLPHSPFVYLPSGARHRASDKTLAKALPHDPSEVLPIYHAELLQLGFLDHQLGLLFERLNQQKLFDGSFIVVASDHGASFLPGGSRRIVKRESAGAIGAVPLFIKEPYQTTEKRHEQLVLTTDVLPTLFELMGAGREPLADGVSALSRARDEMTHHTIVGGFEPGDVTVPVREILKQRDTVIRDRENHFPELFGSAAIAEVAPELIGRDLSTLNPARASDGRAILSSSRDYDERKSVQAVLPVTVTGALELKVMPEKRRLLLIAVNGVVSAIASSRPLVNQRQPFEILVPEGAFHPGRNEIEIGFLAPGEVSGTWVVGMYELAD